MALFIRPVAYAPRLATYAQPLTARFSRAYYSSKPIHTETQTKVAKQTPGLLDHVDPALIAYAESFHKNKKTEFHHCGLSLPGSQDELRSMQIIAEQIEKARKNSPIKK